MRADMAKVLVERPRIGHRITKRRKGYLKKLRKDMASEDGATFHESIKVRGGNQKSFNEHLGPLRRFLDSQVGRPWDKVHAEICKHIDTGNVVQKHILTHLYQYVEREVEIVDGVACYKTRRGWWAGKKIVGPHQWYVCPKTGLLKRAPDWKRRGRVYNPKPKKPLRHWVSNRLMYQRQSDGTWLELHLKPLPDPPSYQFPHLAPPIRDALVGAVAFSDSDRLVSEYGRHVFCVAVRQIAKAELLLLPIPIDLLRPPVQNVVR